ncbi:hypothetical protein O3P69_002331 [Scylla paramamosain]|uniref:Uncharacterized protein n=1 Tax=Scylla paramamosain TaxID=85552 RepID=A0AAW0V6X9_SCYPA
MCRVIPLKPAPPSTPHNSTHDRLAMPSTASSPLHPPASHFSSCLPASPIPPRPLPLPPPSVPHPHPSRLTSERNPSLNCTKKYLRRLPTRPSISRVYQVGPRYTVVWGVSRTERKLIVRELRVEPEMVAGKVCWRVNGRDAEKVCYNGIRGRCHLLSTALIWYRGKGGEGQELAKVILCYFKRDYTRQTVQVSLLMTVAALRGVGVVPRELWEAWLADFLLSLMNRTSYASVFGGQREKGNV